MTLGWREEALEAIKSLVEGKEVEPMFRSLVKESAQFEWEDRGTYKELFTRKEFRIPIIVSILVLISQQFTGCTAVFAYSTDMFVNANLNIDTETHATLAVGIVLQCCSIGWIYGII